MKRNQNGIGLIFISPSLILVGVVVYFGIAYTFWGSTREWSDIRSPSTSIGFANFEKMAQDPTVYMALKHILIFGFLTVLIQMSLGFFAAVMLSGDTIIARNIHKTFIFLPVIISPAVTAISFRQLMSPDGEINSFLRFIGLGFLQHEWLADTRVTLFSLVIINIWQWTSFSFILYQAALSQLDQEILEAAEIDGANYRQVITRIIAPQLKGTHLTLIIMGFIGSMKTFELPFLVTGGGPAGSTEFLTTYIFDQTVSRFKFGYGTTLSVLLCILSITFTVVLLRNSRQRNM